MITIAQAIALIFASIMFVLTMILYKRKKFYLRGFLTWSFIWIVVIVSILFYGVVEYIAEVIIKIQVMDFFLLFAILVIFALLFTIYNELKVTQKKMGEIVESITIKEYTKRGKK